jgi:hypothetical protein
MTGIIYVTSGCPPYQIEDDEAAARSADVVDQLAIFHQDASAATRQRFIASTKEQM